MPTGMIPTGPSSTVVPLQVTIDGITIAPEYAGASGCCVGLNQINFRLPSNLRSGPDIPLTVTIGGVSSNTATIAVQ